MSRNRLRESRGGIGFVGAVAALVVAALLLSALWYYHGSILSIAHQMGL